MSQNAPRALLFDMDGVLYNAEDPIPGAAAALEWVKQQAIPHLFVTNTTSRGRGVLVEKLKRFGIAAAAEQILTPCQTTMAWLRQQPPGKAAVFVRAATRPDFDGLELLPDDAESGADSVIIGDLGEAWDFRTLNRAFRLLQSNPQAHLIALGMTRYWQRPDGLALDVAPFVAALEHATGRRPIVLGKPAPEFFHAAAQQLGLPPHAVAMIGDDIRADVGGAQAAGLQGVLVKTGKFRAADLGGGVRPHVILDSIADLPRWWKT